MVLLSFGLLVILSDTSFIIHLTVLSRTQQSKSKKRGPVGSSQANRRNKGCLLCTLVYFLTVANSWSWIVPFSFLSTFMSILQSLQSNSRILKLTMQINSLNNRGHKAYRYDLPLRPPQPESRRSSQSPIAKSYPSVLPQSGYSYLKVLEAEEYASLQMTMQLKLKNLQENIKICRQKSRIKDKQMQSLAELISKLSRKITAEELVMRKKERQLQSIAIKCQEMASLVSTDQEKVKKEAAYLTEETKKYSTLQEMISSLQEAIKRAEYELQRKQKIYDSLEAMEAENQALKQQYNQLLNEEKLIEYREHHEKSECEDMEKKIEHLTKVLKERLRINKNNNSKLAKLSKELQHLQENLKHKQADNNQIKSLELDIGDLNQELLLINDEVAEFEFKIKRKQQTLEELRDKLHYCKVQAPLPVESVKKQGKEKEIQKIFKGANNLPIQLAHQTPAFPSNLSNEMEFNSEPPKGRACDQDMNGKEAFRNIQKLIKRYEKIKSKDRNGD